MRFDTDGLFWQDKPEKELKKEKLLLERGWLQVFPGFWAHQSQLNKGESPRDICIGLNKAYVLEKDKKEKREPPDPIWLKEDYLPEIKEANDFNPNLFTNNDLIKATLTYAETGYRHKLVFDIESYENYFLIAFKSIETGKILLFEKDCYNVFDINKLEWVMDNFCVIGFNSYNYDIPIASLALQNYTTEQLKEASSQIVEQKLQPWIVLKKNKIQRIKCDHIDVMEVAPLSASLKIYGGRMHTKRMQDLPFHPNSLLNENQKHIVRWYCVNDLTQTEELYLKLEKQIALRQEMSFKYGTDLRSKSDAQVAEAVIKSQMEKRLGYNIKRPVVETGTCYNYKIPSFLRFQTPLMQSVLQTVSNSKFIVSEHGNIGLPKQLKNLKIKINNTIYKMGIGGLHSTEKKITHWSSNNYDLIDVDVTSYYPRIILNLGLFPKHLTSAFLIEYENIVNERIAAKKAGNKVIADSLKITVNGSFGKFGNMYSILYAPDFVIQITLTGQLSLLMLIERLELNNVQVISGNTDGIVIKMHKTQKNIVDNIIKQWEIDTNFQLEDTKYLSLHSRDVNNYIAVKHPSTWKPEDKTLDKVKLKGIFSLPDLSKNPQNEICTIAVIEKIVNNTPLLKTIKDCKDITKFLNVRNVTGGAVKINSEGKTLQYLGKAVRWYYSKEDNSEIVYAKNGNKVPKSEHAKPLMELPEIFPNDVMYDWYENEAESYLKDIGYYS